MTYHSKYIVILPNSKQLCISLSKIFLKNRLCNGSHQLWIFFGIQ
uniref:Uncharacterized protein n=1 Tax=Lepeophtheirus salmonis TaxID=72036 RepID=A0A0K2U5P3_LEPSM